MAVIEQDRLQGSADAAVKAGGAWLRRLSAPRRPRRNGAGSGRLVAVVEIALVILLAAACAPLFWALFAPAPSIEAAPAVVQGAAAPAAVGNPFRIADAAAASLEDVAPASVETTLDLALHGTWVDIERPSAIIRLPDGVQKTFFVGDTICCGAILAGVYTDQVTIERNGAHEALRLPNKGLATSPAPVVEQPPQQPQGIGHIISFRPMQGNGVFRLQLFAGDDAELFQRLGLRDGDILVSINNQPAPDDLASFAQLLDGLQGSRMISVTVERDGVRMPLDIPLEGASAIREPVE